LTIGKFFKEIVCYEMLLINQGNETIKSLSETTISLILTYGRRYKQFLIMKNKAEQDG